MLKIVLLLPLILFCSDVLALSGCKVIGPVVDCSNLGLINFPDFPLVVPRPRDITVVNLQNNNIQTIPAHAFNGLQQISHPITINLERNRITTIHDGAFDAVYATLKTLKLRYNKLKTVPNDIGKLNALTSLDIKDNEFQNNDLDVGITDRVFRLIGDTLTEFHFGGGNLFNWPNVALTHFQKLDTLDYEGGYLSFIPYSGFHGFEHTLKKLYITKTEMRQIPLGLSTLEQLVEFHFDDNSLVGDYGILSQAFATTTHKISPLKILSLRNDSLTRFPAVLHDLKNLESLDMGNNKLWYVADDAINLLKNSTLTTMGLSGCSLDRIPQALLQLRGLYTLDVSENNIQSIERYDLSNHDNITVLNVSGNPLAYVSSEALNNLPNLTTIDFSRTSMTHIPLAITKPECRK